MDNSFKIKVFLKKIGGFRQLLITLFLLQARYSYALNQCESLFQKELLPAATSEFDFVSTNPTAQLSFFDYLQPNNRSLSDYNEGLDVILQDIVGSGDIVIDLGGGKGKAMKQLAARTGSHAIVINTQSQNSSQILTDSRRKGSFEYRQGWVEEILPEYKEYADVVIDFWGAFSYSIKKVQIIEAIYASLKVGGVAYIYFDPFKSISKVFELSKEKIDLADWLSKTFPDVFSITKPSSYFVRGKVLVIKKSHRDYKLSIPLRMQQYRIKKFQTNMLPEVFYIELKPTR